jgi:hypothetical protein
MDPNDKCNRCIRCGKPRMCNCQPYCSMCASAVIYTCICVKEQPVEEPVVEQPVVEQVVVKQQEPVVEQAVPTVNPRVYEMLEYFMTSVEHLKKKAEIQERLIEHYQHDQIQYEQFISNVSKYADKLEEKKPPSKQVMNTKKNTLKDLIEKTKSEAKASPLKKKVTAHGAIGRRTTITKKT